jgi:hypothetical protein
VSRYVFRFRKLKVYNKANDLWQVLHEISTSLSPAQYDLRDMLRKHSLLITLEIVRGASRPPRRQAEGHFRSATRSAELCESVLIGLAQTGIPTKGIETAATEAGELKAMLCGIAENIASGARAPDVFRDA